MLTNTPFEDDDAQPGNARGDHVGAALNRLTAAVETQTRLLLARLDRWEERR
ncbi:hypothetical protein [Agromyces intestinalis]|uniref:hypothetical protein n=1 Tax=Agromyces intestinalis TaxID=2592652 RepID=UPI00143D22AC|nr:hypothetical protein [Agromyces intestinalis]